MRSSLRRSRTERRITTHTGRCRTTRPTPAGRQRPSNKLREPACHPRGRPRRITNARRSRRLRLPPRRRTQTRSRRRRTNRQSLPKEFDATSTVRRLPQRKVIPTSSRRHSSPPTHPRSTRFATSIPRGGVPDDASPAGGGRSDVAGDAHRWSSRRCRPRSSTWVRRGGRRRAPARHPSANAAAPTATCDMTRTTTKTAVVTAGTVRPRPARRAQTRGSGGSARAPARAIARPRWRRSHRRSATVAPMGCLGASERPTRLVCRSSGGRALPMSRTSLRLRAIRIAR